MTEENEQQMEQLFHDHYERMYRLAFALLHDNDAAKDVVRRTAPDAIHQIIGFYPIKMTVDGENIFVECTQKTSGKMIGRIVDAHQRPIDFANVSLTPRVGLWAPRLSLVLMWQDFDMVHNGETLKLNNPLLMTNWYNSFSISEDYILTADITGHTYGDNTIATLKPSYQLNLGITKKLKQWTFQLQATDVFRTARNSVFAYGTSMLLDKWNYSDSQAVKLTVSYRFNSVNSKYKGTGAGNEEKNRF